MKIMKKLHVGKLKLFTWAAGFKNRSVLKL